MKKMNTTTNRLYQNALQLPDTERAELAARLIESLDPEMDQDLDTAWSAEIERRIRELDDGTVKSIPWPEARRMIAGELDGPAAS